MSFRLRSDRGDTIVEVLIAVAVVSSVLAITYSVMNRNLQILRTNQERTEASKLAQSQLEQLKSVSEGPQSATIPTGITARTFCLGSGSVEDASFGSDAATTDILADNFVAYPEICRSSYYHISVKYNSSENYTVRVRWDGLTGDRNEVLMGYKIQ